MGERNDGKRDRSGRERNKDWTKRERERQGWEREIERGYRCGIKRERQGIILLPSLLPFSSQEVISYNLYIMYHNDSGEKIK